MGGQGNNGLRDSKAWAGMMTGDLSDEDSDSDNSDAERPGPMRSMIPPAPVQYEKPSGGRGGVRDSWSTRAAAVGSRPPDTASQNPPSLKLLGLKSVKEGGTSLGSNGDSKPPLSPALTMRQQVERRQQEEQRRQQHLGVENDRQTARNRTPSPAFDMVDEGQQRRQQDAHGPSHSSNLRVTRAIDDEDHAGRHGSMIAFGGTDGFGGADHNNAAPNGPSSHRYELRDEPMPAAAPRQPRQQPAGLEPPRNPYGNQPTSPRTALTQQLGLGSDRNPSPNVSSPRHGPTRDQDGFPSSGRAPSPMALPRSAERPTERNLVSPGGSNGPSPPQGPMRMGAPQSPYGPPSGTGSGMQDANGVPLHRGPMPQQRNGPTTGRGHNGPPPAQPIALPSPVHMPANMQRGPSPIPPASGPNQSRGMPPMQNPEPGRYAPSPGPGFSDSPGPRSAPARRPSLFRRSKAFIMGGANVDADQGGQRQGPGPMRAQGQQQRRSLFRRSMALLTGRGPPQGGIMPNPDADDDSDAPAPRVQGFIDEKPKDRKSHYLGGGGMGDEWDFNGSGSRFWKRFSVAQHKLQDGEFKDSELVRKKVARRQKVTLWSSLIGGLIIIAAVAAVIIWRENVKSSDVPGAVAREKNGAGEDLDQQMSRAAANTNMQQTQDSSGSASTSAATSRSTSTTTNASTQDDGDDDDGDERTTTKKSKKKSKKKKKKTKHNDDERRRDFVHLEATANLAVNLVRRQVEDAFPSAKHMTPVHSSLDGSQMMVRRRRHD